MENSVRIALISAFINHAIPGDVYADISKKTGADKASLKRLFYALRMAGVLDKSSPHNSREASFKVTAAGLSFYYALMNGEES